MKKFLSLALATLMTVSLAACGSSPAPAASSGTSSASSSSQAVSSGSSSTTEAKYVLKLCTEQTEGDPIDMGCDKWAELVSEATDGAVKIEVYPSSQLGAKADLIEMMLMGQNVCTIADGSYLMDYVPDFGVVMGPFLFTDWNAMYKITASDWWQDMSSKLEDQGLKIVSTNWIYGERQLMTKTPIKSLSDLKGLKIRVPNNDISVAMFNDLGSAATPMALNDVYTSLSQGVVDGVENPLTTLYNNKFQEVCKYVTMTSHQMTFSNFIVGEQFWSSLPKEYQDAIVSCGEEAAKYNNDLYQQVSKDMQDKLTAAGCTISTLDPKVQEDFKNACLSLYKNYESNGTWSKGLYDQIQKIINS